jgi:hypothetical protein
MKRSIPETPDNKTLDILIETLQNLKIDIEKAEYEGNKSAAKRVRKKLLEIEKISKVYRLRMLKISKASEI